MSNICLIWTFPIYHGGKNNYQLDRRVVSKWLFPSFFHPFSIKPGHAAWVWLTEASRFRLCGKGWPKRTRDCTVLILVAAVAFYCSPGSTDIHSCHAKSSKVATGISMNFLLMEWTANSLRHVNHVMNCPGIWNSSFWGIRESHYFPLSTRREPTKAAIVYYLAVALWRLSLLRRLTTDHWYKVMLLKAAGVFPRLTQCADLPR